MTNTELIVIQRHHTGLRTVLGGEISYFASVLYEKGLISEETKHEVTTLHGVGGREKADKLLDKVCIHLAISQDKEKRFYVLTSIFSAECAYEDLAESMKECYSGKIYLM